MIDTLPMTQIEIYEAGLEVLSRELGAVGMIRFLQMFEKGKGDYTKERHQWLDHFSIEDVIDLAMKEQEGEG
jgi:hypothetical protein